MCMETAVDPFNPYKQNKVVMLRQYTLWNSEDMKKTELPPLNLPGNWYASLPPDARTPNTSRVRNVTIVT